MIDNKALLATGLNLCLCQFIIMSVVGFFWNIFLCFITSSHGTIKSLKSVPSIVK
jgi:hypothetical protein